MKYLLIRGIGCYVDKVYFGNFLCAINTVPFLKHNQNIFDPKDPKIHTDRVEGRGHAKCPKLEMFVQVFINAYSIIHI